MRNFLPALCICVAAALSPVDAYGYDVYQANMPDVEKADHGDTGRPTCWLAAAANQLAAAGWALGDANAIYDAFTNANWYGTNSSGWCAVAANAYLVKQLHKQGPPSNNPYINLHVHNSAGLAPMGPKGDDWAAAGATYTDYGGLLNDLAAARYVNIGIRPSLSEGGHCVTLVGGDYYNPNGTARGQAVIHDNEGDLSDPAGNDDAYNNSGTPTWTTNYNTDWECYYASVLGKWNFPINDRNGSNYLASYYPTQTESGQFVKEWAVRDTGYSYSPPVWTGGQSVQVFQTTGGSAPHDVYLFIDFTSTIGSDPNIVVLDANGQPGVLADKVWADDRGYARYHFHFDADSPYLQILFPDGSYNDLSGQVINWHVTDVPEPATGLVLVLLACLPLLRRNRT